MIGRGGLGPVFVYDMISLARRWQVYAARAGFVLFLLIGITITWTTTTRWAGLTTSVGRPTIAQLAEIGKQFYYALAGVQISFILLAAPAAAAGSICIDRARGTLLHMMVTDLSDAEIVLGRLAARLLPVFGLVACAVPVISVAGLLGGIDFGAILGLFVVSIDIAILGCSLALAISIKANKTHEVLMAVYLAFGVWLLSLPIWGSMTWGTKFAGPPDWFANLNPFVLAYAPYLKPTTTGIADFVIFSAVLLVISALLVLWSVLRLRKAVVETSVRRERVSRLTNAIARFWPKLPGPTLDGNPVLWREWHRNRPSRMAKWLWRGLFFVTWGMVACGVFQILNDGVTQGPSMMSFGFMIHLFFGLLLVAATASTVLAEERTRGSLDILLSTPLSTHSIIVAKWWGAYRTILGLAILPLFTAVFLACATPDLPVMPGTSTFKWPIPPVPLTQTDRFASVVFCMGDYFVSAALIVTIGVLLATWISRIGRAVGTSVVIYFLLGIGWPITAEVLFLNFLNRASTTQSVYHNQTIMNAVTAMSPALGPITAVQSISNWTFEPRDFLWQCLTYVILFKLLGTLILFGITLWTFNRCLGRVVESRPANYQPPTGPRVRRSKKRRPRPEHEPSLAGVSDSPSPLP